jgi:serine/threonine protein kinase
MKYCPQCRQRYGPTERFCSIDGSQLSLEDPYHLVGRTLNNYQIDSLVGIGGMGAVYSAYQLGVDRRVAFKILQPNVVLSNQQVVKLFEREAQMAGRLNHENIAIIYDAGHTEDNIWYIAMEWLEGTTLADELSGSRPMTLARAAHIFRQIAAALDTAHGSYIVHRDLKPSNIMLINRPERREIVKVLDFGIGKVISDTAGSPASESWGTPLYASPEQFHPGTNIDRRADIYSLGVMLYQTLAGELPYNASSIEELIHLHVHSMPTPIRELRPEIPESIDQMIGRMLSRDPNDRPQRAGAVAELLSQTFETGSKPAHSIDDLEELLTHPTLEMAHILSIALSEHSGIEERTAEGGNARLTDLEPFGEADCESELKVMGSSEYSKYYFDHTRFNRDALSPKVFLIIGRRGAGKTALSQFFSFQQLMPNVTTIEVNEPASFQQLMSKVAESAADTREIAIPRLVKIWEFVIWSTIFWHLQDKDPRIKAACPRAEETRNVSTFIRHVLKSLVARFLKSNSSLSDELEDFISSEAIQKAKRAVLEVVKGGKVIIALDTMENYAVRDESMMRSMGALIQCASRFSRDYSHHGVYLKVFIMAEIFPYLKEEVSLNPLKFIHDEIYLQWRPKDLMRLISWRYDRYLKRNNLLTPSTGKVDWDNHHDVLREKWEPYWGKKIHTRRGLVEETFPYVLRHTQLRPRQLIVLCNSVARHAQDAETFPQFGPESIIEGIQRAEKRLAEEVMNSYSSVYPGAARIAEALSGLPVIFKGNQLDKRAPQSASQWPPGEYSPYAFRQFVSELGIVGRVRNVSEKTGIVEADFEYAGESRISLQVGDDCVIHPMFYKKLNVRMTRNLCVYPFPDHEEFRFEVSQAL